MSETFRVERTDKGDFVWAGDRRFPAAQLDIDDITYATVTVRRRRAYIDLDSNWSLGLFWSEGSLSDNCTERMAARDGVFIEEPHTVEVSCLQYGALVVGENMPDADPAMVRAMACELEMLHEDDPAPLWTRSEVEVMMGLESDPGSGAGYQSQGQAPEGLPPVAPVEGTLTSTPVGAPDVGGTDTGEDDE